MTPDKVLLDDSNAIPEDIGPFAILRHQGVHSVSINLSYWIALELMIRDEQIILVHIGDHDAVY